VSSSSSPLERLLLAHGSPAQRDRHLLQGTKNIAENAWCGAYGSCNLLVELAASRVLLVRGFLKKKILGFWVYWGRIW
jgi:hypothetical protein